MEGWVEERGKEGERESDRKKGREKEERKIDESKAYFFIKGN